MKKNNFDCSAKKNYSYFIILIIDLSPEKKNSNF